MPVYIIMLDSWKVEKANYVSKTQVVVVVFFSLKGSSSVSESMCGKTALCPNVEVAVFC